MSGSALGKCLRKMTPQQWYELLNSRVFFWLTQDRLLGLLAARAYRDRKHCVLTVDTSELVACHEKHISLSPINSGSTVYRPQARGADTFLSIEDYPFEKWAKKRGRKKAIAELVVNHAVERIADVVLMVEIRQGDRIVKTVWKR